MDTNEIHLGDSVGEFITEEDKKAVISQANIVKQDIDQLLMYLGANRDINAIAQKMAQLGQNIADLYTYIHNATSVARQRAMPYRAGSLRDFV